MAKLAAIEAQMLASPDQQVSLTDPDSRSMATSGHGLWCRLQCADCGRHHASSVVVRDVIDIGNDRALLARIAKEAKAALESESLDVVADRGYFDSGEILACEESGITVTLPKPMTSGAKAEGRFGKQDFVYVAEDDIYLCPAGARLVEQIYPAHDDLLPLVFTGPH